MRKATIFLFLVILLTLCAAPVYAKDVPPLPHAFYGDVDINDSPARAGTIVEARVDGVQTGTYNPITTTEPGKYGSADPLGAKLIVQGDIQEEDPITFYVTNPNGTAIAGTYPFDSGEVTSLELSVTIEAPPVGDGVAGPAVPTIETTLFGKLASFPISLAGKILQTVKATSEDGMLTITIPMGTIALDKDGKALKSLDVAVDESPPDPPEDAHVIGLAYSFEPEGATFDPAITFTWSYDPDALPEGVAEEDLVLAYYDGKKWVELDCVVDTKNNTITAQVSHFTTFAIIGKVKPAAFTLSSLVISPTEVAPDEKVNISVSLANTGGMEGRYTTVLKINGVKEADKSVTVAAGGKQPVAFSVTRKEAGDYAVALDGLRGSFTVLAPVVVAPPPKPPVPPPAPPPAPPPVPLPAPAPPAPPSVWLFIMIGVAAAVVVLLVLYLVVLRRRRY